MINAQTQIRQLKGFSTVMSAGCGALALAFFLRHRPGVETALVFSAAFLLAGLIAPKILTPFYRVWMMLARLLSWVNTRLLLIIVYYGLITPVGLCLRMFGKDPLQRRWDARCDSYWIPRTAKPLDRRSYERQY